MSISPPDAVNSLDESSSDLSGSGNESNGQDRRNMPTHKSSQQKGMETFHHVLSGALFHEIGNGNGQGGNNQPSPLGHKAQPGRIPDVATLARIQARALADHRQLASGRPLADLYSRQPWHQMGNNGSHFSSGNGIGEMGFSVHAQQRGQQYGSAQSGSYGMQYGVHPAGIPHDANAAITLAFLQAATGRNKYTSSKDGGSSSSSCSSSSSFFGDCAPPSGMLFGGGNFSPHQRLHQTETFSPQSSTGSRSTHRSGSEAANINNIHCSSVDMTAGVSQEMIVSNRNALLEYENELLRQKLQRDSEEKVNLVQMLLFTQMNGGQGGNSHRSAPQGKGMAGGMFDKMKQGKSRYWSDEEHQRFLDAVKVRCYTDFASPALLPSVQPRRVSCTFAAASCGALTMVLLALCRFTAPTTTRLFLSLWVQGLRAKSEATLKSFSRSSTRTRGTLCRA